jgi:hypothetical protein
MSYTMGIWPLRLRLGGVQEFKTLLLFLLPASEQDHARKLLLRRYH